MFDYKRLLSSPSAYIRYNAELIINKTMIVIYLMKW
jgi:hypothetical protein